MRKVLLFISMVLTLVTLLVFGMFVFAAIAGLTAPAQDDISAGSVNVPQVAPTKSIVFDPEAINYQISQPGYNWIDISANHDEQITAADFEDNIGSAAIDIDFYFPFFNNIYRQLRLSDNGYIYFDGDETTGGNTPQAVPSNLDLIHNLIAPLGADLFRVPNDSAVYIARQTEPERRLILQFKNAYWCCNLEHANDFQIILYPDGHILTQYKVVQHEGSPPVFLTVGIENEDGTRGHNFYTGLLTETDAFDSPFAVLYDPGNTIFGRLLFISAAETNESAPGQVTMASTDLLNLSSIDSSFTISHTLQVNGVDTPLHLAEPEQSNSTDTPSTEPIWRMNIVAEPGQVNHTEAKPLTVEITIPEGAAVGDTAVIVFTASSDSVADLEATFTFTIDVTDDNSN